MGAEMLVQLNGVVQALPPGATVVDAVGRAGAPERGVAVAVNGVVVPRGSWSGTPLSAGDKLEVLTAAQGG